MCTAITYKTNDHYFGRNLDMEFSYDESVTITPRSYKFNFKNAKASEKQYAMIGMAYVVSNYPLYYDATNEKGLSMAGLKFPDNADYKPINNNKDNIAPFELIPWVLSQCADIYEAKNLLEHTSIAKLSFSEKLPLTPLHWIVAYKNRSITVESVKDGLKIYDNPVGVLTNNPPFDFQIFNLNNYLKITSETPENNFSDKLNLEQYSRGMGALGLPGDLSSSSRFVRAVFTKLNSVCGQSESESISQFFHILDTVAHPRGCVEVANGKYQITVYSSCCNTDRGIYYYTTYENRQITAVNMHRENLDSDKLVSYQLVKGENIKYQN